MDESVCTSVLEAFAAHSAADATRLMSSSKRDATHRAAQRQMSQNAASTRSPTHTVDVMRSQMWSPVGRDSSTRLSSAEAAQRLAMMLCQRHGHSATSVSAGQITDVSCNGNIVDKMTTEVADLISDMSAWDLAEVIVGFTATNEQNVEPEMTSWSDDRIHVDDGHCLISSTQHGDGRWSETGRHLQWTEGQPGQADERLDDSNGSTVASLDRGQSSRAARRHSGQLDGFDDGQSGQPSGPPFTAGHNNGQVDGFDGSRPGQAFDVVDVGQPRQSSACVVEKCLRRHGVNLQ